MKQATNRRRISVALAGLILLGLGWWLVKDLSGGQAAGIPTRTLSALPPEVARTWRLIEAGGPFPYPHLDGATFDNRDERLPRKPSGYYHEYTVPTPGSADPGPRRLVTGGGHELYYTGDQDRTFVAVDSTR